MDSFSHAAWGATIVRKNPQIWWAALSGALPDLLTFIYGFLKFRRKYFKYLSDLAWYDGPQDPYLKVYYFSHSLIPITAVAIILYFISPAYTIIVIPYYLHIFLDIFTHQGVWATRLFFPISKFHFDGRNWWKNKWMTIGNWAVLVVINLIIFLV